MMEGRRGRDAPVVSEVPEVKSSFAAETLAEVPRRRTSGHKRKSASSLPSVTGPSSIPAKRLIKERNALNIVPGSSNGPCTRARQFPSKFSTGSPQMPQEGAATADAVVVEVGKEILAPGDLVKSGDEVASPPVAPTVCEEFEAVRSRGVSVHVVPTPAGWFSWKKIHELEKHALPSFFNGQTGSRTTEIYMEIRNSIVKKFHFDPQTPLETKDLLEVSAGELSDRKEVMEFLDHWGLINFHPFPHCSIDASVTEAGSEKISSLLNQLYRFEIAESLPSYIPKKQELSSPSMLHHLIPESSLLDDMVRPTDPSVEYHCNSCSADCSRRRYHCQKQADFDLCADCYNNGRFGVGMIPADFILMESAEVPGVSGQSWTDQETLLLLEALELFGENWNEIAEHVATKTKAQCILHFLQMPIEDPFLDVKENASVNMPEKVVPYPPNTDPSADNVPEAMDHDTGMSFDQPVSSPADDSGREDAEVDLSSESYTNFAINALKSAFQAVRFTNEAGSLSSFAEAGNPVMTLAAFLAGLVDQDAVATSSSCSLKAMVEESPGTQLVSRNCFILEEPPNDAMSPAPESTVATSGDEDIVKEQQQLPVLNHSAALKNMTENNEPNGASEQSEMKQSPSNEFLENSTTQKELSDSILPEDVVANSIELSDDKPFPEEQNSQSDKKDASSFDEPMVTGTSNSKELDDLCQHGFDEPVIIGTFDPKELEVLSRHGGDATATVKFVDDQKVSEGDTPKSTEQLNNPDSIDQAQQILNSQVVACTILASIDLKEEELQQKDGAASTIDVNEVAGGDENKSFSTKNDRNISATAYNISSINRAAVSVLSVAAVKAKLLADQEEDHIRQLVSCVIEKQLCKMEIKLAFFPELENLIIRAKDQTEKARQKLINERSAIIAARLRLPQPVARSFPASLSNSKLAMGYGSMSTRPPSMAYQRPPPPRRT